MENNKFKILAIDDNKDNLISLKALIKEAFPDSITLTAENGTAGIKMAQIEDPEVILLDVVMPGMDGFEVCQKLKANPETSNIPVVFLTALGGDKRSRIRALEVGAEAFLAKPIDETELTAQVRAMLKIKTANDHQRNEKERLAQLVKEQTRELEQVHIATLNLLDDLREENIARKRNEDALRESEQSFRALTENSGDYIMRYDHEHRHVYANPRAIQVSGRTSAEYIGKTHREMGFPEALCALWETAIDQVFTTGQSYGEVFKWESAEGAIVLDWRLFPEMDSQGRVIFVLGVSRDISDRLEAEQILAKSEEQFRTLASLAPVGIYLTKPDGTCIYTNPTWQNMAGFSAEEALGYGWVDGIHPDDRDMVFSNWQKMVESQGEWGFEYRFQNHEGKTTIVFGLATAQKDASGNIVGYIGVNIDITERKQAEIFSKNLVTMNPVSIQVLDSNGFTLEVNPAFKLLFGSVPPADYSIFNDPQLAQKGIGKIFDQLRNGEVIHFPDVSFNPHVSIPEMPDVPNWVRTIGFPICSGNEKPERFVLLQENISEQKNAEETLLESEFKFRQTFDVSPVGIVMVGLDARFIQCNLAFAQSLGYEAEELVGKRIEDITLPEDRQIGKAEMVAIVKGEIAKSQVQKRYLRKDGQVIWGEVTISLIRDTNGHAQYFLAIIQNITERKQAEARINDQLTELKRWHNITLGREERIYQLKSEVNRLLIEAGKPPHYASAVEEAPE